MATQTLEQQAEDVDTLSKSRMLSTISRYSLGNEIKRVKWKIEDGELFTGFVSPDNSVFGVLTVQDFPIEDSKIGIFDTKRLKALVRILEDEFTVSLEKHGGEYRLMVLDDGKKTIQFELASLDVIPNTPQLKRLPDWQVEAEITDEFIDDFRSAEGAINQDQFGIKTDADGVNVVVGETSDGRNSNKVNIPLQVDSFEPLSSPVVFRSDLFAEILKANQDNETGYWEISEEGLCRVSFEGEDWETTYYILSEQLDNI